MGRWVLGAAVLSLCLVVSAQGKTLTPTEALEAYNAHQTNNPQFAYLKTQVIGDDVKQAIGSLLNIAAEVPRSCSQEKSDICLKAANTLVETWGVYLSINYAKSQTGYQAMETILTGPVADSSAMERRLQQAMKLIRLSIEKYNKGDVHPKIRQAYKRIVGYLDGSLAPAQNAEAILQAMNSELESAKSTEIPSGQFEADRKLYANANAPQSFPNRGFVIVKCTDFSNMNAAPYLRVIGVRQDRQSNQMYINSTRDEAKINRFKNDQASVLQELMADGETYLDSDEGSLYKKGSDGKARLVMHHYSKSKPMSVEDQLTSAIPSDYTRDSYYIRDAGNGQWTVGMISSNLRERKNFKGETVTIAEMVEQSQCTGAPEAQPSPQAGQNGQLANNGRGMPPRNGLTGGMNGRGGMPGAPNGAFPGGPNGGFPGGPNPFGGGQTGPVNPAMNNFPPGFDPNQPGAFSAPNGIPNGIPNGVPNAGVPGAAPGVAPGTVPGAGVPNAGAPQRPAGPPGGFPNNDIGT